MPEAKKCNPSIGGRKPYWPSRPNANATSSGQHRDVRPAYTSAPQESVWTCPVSWRGEEFKLPDRTTSEARCIDYSEVCRIRPCIIRHRTGLRQVSSQGCGYLTTLDKCALHTAHAFHTHEYGLPASFVRASASHEPFRQNGVSKRARISSLHGRMVTRSPVRPRRKGPEVCRPLAEVFCQANR